MSTIAIGAGARLVIRQAPTPEPELPAADLVGPAYKFFDVSEAAQLAVRPDQAIVPATSLPLPSELRSPHPRARGGFDKGRAWRWLPIVDALTADGRWRGSPVAGMAHFEGPLEGAIFAALAVGDEQWYDEAAASELVAALERWIAAPALMLDGGTDHFTYFEDQPVTLGIRAGTFGAPRHLTARVTLTADAEPVLTREWPLQLEPGRLSTVADVWSPTDWPAAGLTATAELLDGGRVIDRLTHDVHCWRPPARRTFVTVEGGEFRLGPDRWRPHGVNYMPSSGVASDDFEYFHQWLAAGPYDPEVVDRDLAVIAGLGLNAVSVFVFRDDIGSQNLVDFLRRAGEHGLKVNLSIRHHIPECPEQMAPILAGERLLAAMREVVESARLADNDTLFAYDLVWEPTFGPQSERTAFDSEWEAWVTRRYGSIEQAEAAWEHPVPRDAEGKVTNPTADQLAGSGPWTRMVAAYRAFLDELLGDRYGRARDLLRAADPNHLVSFRMWEAGNPTWTWWERIPYDFRGLTQAVDFWAPEAYGRIDGWEKVKAGRFTFEWARLADPGKPVIWSEVGIAVGAAEVTPEALERQRRFFADMHRMILESGAAGIFYWFYPGGYRPDEGHDYGILNPGGTDRPASEEIRRWAPRLAAGDPAKPIDHWIEVDRDAHPSGLTGVYEQVRDEFWSAIAEGRTPGLRSRRTTGD